MELRIHGAIKQSIVDGTGLRFTLFVQGCPHRCTGCQNPQTHDFDGGYTITPQRVLDEFFKNPLLAGITFSGGEPLLQAEQLLPIAKEIVNAGKNCIIYSGYTFEEILQKNDPAQLELLSYCIWLVDGQFMEGQKDLTLLFRGSKNQRIIDLKPSLLGKIPVIIEDTTLLQN